MGDKKMAPFASFNYVIVSPVKDEEKYVRRTLDTVVAQTVRPLRWVIVDDGSIDRTPEIVKEYAERHTWITVLRKERDGLRNLGVAEIEAFARGYKLIEGLQFEYIVKLDCDLELPSDYFEVIFSRFKEDQKLGIASGVYLELTEGQWKPVSMPEYHAAGASKVVKRQCFEEMHGFPLYRGWDTIDEIRARMRGWKTGHFADIAFRHLKVEGSAAGPLATNRMHGQIYYLTGGGMLFLLLKVMHRCWTGRPFVVGGLMMLAGFLGPLMVGSPKGVTAEEAKFYRRMLMGRVATRIGAVV